MENPGRGCNNPALEDVFTKKKKTSGERGLINISLYVYISYSLPGVL